MMTGFAGMIIVWMLIQIVPTPSEGTWIVQAILAVLFLASAAVTVVAGGAVAWETLR